MELQNIAILLCAAATLTTLIYARTEIEDLKKDIYLLRQIADILSKLEFERAKRNSDD